MGKEITDLSTAMENEREEIVNRQVEKFTKFCPLSSFHL